MREKNGEYLHTSTVCLAAIYGPSEERQFQKIVSMVKLLLLPFRIDEANVKQDWIYVDNLVLALVLARMALLDDIPSKPFLLLNISTSIEQPLACVLLIIFKIYVSSKILT
ncbi:hypothetical protein Patl1_21362 [Pistacia atlantica]|uniref:Uncharacterized protein n=1 Tax=Pistacia atlantica TaxID=434234 RepID=A0ACC1BJQ0_9ROSI|nr:hypothetical protein Patl1_21362 [Pistacia atlantica]